MAGPLPTMLRSVLLALGITITAPALAQEQLVYWPMVTDGAEYRRISYPQEAGSLVVLADTAVILEARMAPVSYWPITREYLADFASSPPTLSETLEIVDDEGTVEVVEPQPYLIWHEDGVGAGPAEIIQGDGVISFYEDYVQQARDAAARMQAYQRVVAEHHAVVEAWIKIAAQRPADLPPPPPELTLPEPEPYRAYASEPAEAPIVSLPAGSYTIRLRDAGGAVVPGSERALVSLGPLASGTGYVVRPGNRWTQPTVSFSPSETIYTTGQTDLFFQPVPVLEYEAQPYERLFRPQSVETADRFQTIWIPSAQDEAAGRSASLALWQGDEQVSELPTTAYRVTQVAGASRGYAIEEFTPQERSSLEPDFQAMRVAADAAITHVSLVDGDEAVPVSTRRVRTVDLPPLPWLFLPSFLPLAVCLGLVVHRRMRNGRSRHDPQLALGTGTR